MRSSILSIAFLAVLLIGSSVVMGQETPGATKPAPPAGRIDREDDQKPNVMMQLELSPEQMQQIRQLNKQRKPHMVAAQERLRVANRSLDQAIYADTLNEADIEARVKELQAAQSDLIGYRSASELAIRRILTPEQLVRFRGIRAEFEQKRQQQQENRRSMRPRRMGSSGNQLNQRRRPI
jgi:Spy/CpxP family protein refolding chaperone